MTGRKASQFPLVRDLRQADVMMYVILAVVVFILIFAIHTLFREIERKMQPRAVAVPAPVSPVAKRTGPVLTASTSRGPRPVRTEGGAGPFGHYGGSCAPEYRGAQLKLAYDVSFEQSSGGYARGLDSMDLAGCRALEFQVKGETGDEVFAIRFDDGRVSDQVHVSSLFPDSLPREWKKASVPLTDFPHLKSIRRAGGKFSIVFDHGFGMPYQGTVYFKDIRFVR